jgi:uncharacterized protein YndB with AHSA1/START domain
MDRATFDRAMKLCTTASITVAKPRAQVFEFCTKNDTFERLLRPLGPIAGIRKAELHAGQTLQPGARRTITMTDGSVLEEEVLDYTPPSRHRYRWTEGVKPPFSWLVKSGTGCWDFSEIDGGTRVDWSYVFELRSPLAYPLARPIIPLFRRWLMKGLEAIAAELAKQSAAH